jgi:hypothetical protein
MLLLKSYSYPMMQRDQNWSNVQAAWNTAVAKIPVCATSPRDVTW